MAYLKAVADSRRHFDAIDRFRDVLAPNLGQPWRRDGERIEAHGNACGTAAGPSVCPAGGTTVADTAQRRARVLGRQGRSCVE